MGNTNTKTKTVDVYMKPVGESLVFGESNIYRSADFMEGISHAPADSSTYQQVWQRHFNEFPDRDFLGYLPKKADGELEGVVKYYTFSEIKEYCTNLGSGMEHLKMTPERKEYKDYCLKFVGVYSKNTVQWIQLDCACTLYGITTVPVYDTLGEEAVEFAFNNTQLTTLFLTTNHLHGIFEAYSKEKTGVLEYVVIMDEENFDQKLQEEYEEIKKSTKLKVFKMSEIVEIGKKNNQAYPKVNGNDIYTISYTSGTTGEPKGALISNANMMSAIHVLTERVGAKIGENMTTLSYLPLAHIMERATFANALLLKGKYVLFNGDVLKLKIDLAIVKPTIFMSVPRLFNKFAGAIQLNTSKLTGLKKTLFEKGKRTKLEN